MTLIAGIRVGQCPILLGDLLISSEIAPTRPVVLPTVGALPEDLVPAGTYHITGTAQICIINGRLAVAWAGRRIYARDITRRMERHFSNGRIDGDCLESFFRSQEVRHLNELQMICWYCNERGLNSFGVNTTNIDTDGFGHCHAGGTGTGDFIELLYAENQSRVIQGESNALHQGMSIGLALASQILAREIVHGGNLPLYYGGGVEIATYADGRYQKIGDISHLFWTYDATKKEDGLRFIPISYKLDYLNRNLVIRRLVFGDNKGRRVLKSNATFVLSALNAKIGNRKLDLSRLPDLNAQYLVNHTFIKTRERETIAKITIHRSNERKGPFRVTETKDELVLSFHREFFGNELRSVMEGYGQFGHAVDVRD